MKAFLQRLVIHTVLEARHAGSKARGNYSRYALAKGFRQFRKLAIRQVKDVLLITAGVFSAAFGFKGFLLTNHFIDGGATGLSLLTSQLTRVPLGVLIIVINIPFVVLAFTVVGRTFAIKTCVAIAALALVLATVTFPNVTDDKLLVAIFGGFFLGAGIGLSVRGGAVIDGTEVLAIFLSRKLGTTIGDIIILINVLIFGTAAYFLNVEIALYSMITYLAASKMLDFVVEGIDEYIGVTIVSSHHEEIRQMIMNDLGRGITVYQGIGGFGKQGTRKEMDILYTVITRLEVGRLNTEIHTIDPNAFVVMSAVKDTKGGITKRRSIPHG